MIMINVIVEIMFMVWLMMTMTMIMIMIVIITCPLYPLPGTSFAEYVITYKVWNHPGQALVVTSTQNITS
jgi:hypothetical protein